MRYYKRQRMLKVKIYQKYSFKINMPKLSDTRLQTLLLQLRGKIIGSYVWL